MIDLGLLRNLLRNLYTDQESEGDSSLVWNSALAEKAARINGALSKEELDRARGILRSGGYLSWEWTFRLLQMADPTRND